MKRIGRMFLWGAALAGVSVLLVAAVNDRGNSKCKGVQVALKGDDRNAFINIKDIKNIIQRDGRNPVGLPIREISLSNLEKVVERDPWVRSAELYFDNNQVLNVDVRQRDPLARVFTFSGNSFYMDGEGERIPVSERFTARVPVFTGFPTDAVQLKKDDSLLYAQMGDLARYIAADTFWTAQIEQVVVTSDRKFELIPKFGDHVIVFGDGTDIDTKLTKLLIFYRKGLSKAGWNTYSRINIAYRDEVIGTRRDGKSAPPPPMYKDSSAADIPALADDDDARRAPVAAKPAAVKKENTASPAPAARKPAARKPEKAAGQKPKAVYARPNNNRNRN
ncbi:cell division protein FtsQ/DivIB [Chitinophaga lutea]